MKSKKKKKTIVTTSSFFFVRKSSSIDLMIDDNVLIAKFFKWLAKKTSKKRHNRLIKVYLVVLDQKWTMNNLKQMTNLLSILYRVTI